MSAPQVYVKELAKKCHGYPLWEPDPGDNLPVGIADVGFTRDGDFVRLFNASQEPSNVQGLNSTVPNPYIPLRVGQIRRRAPLERGSISSGSVLRRNVELGIDAGLLSPGMELSFSRKTSHEQRATLILGEDAYRQDALNRGEFRTYIRENYQSWLALANETLQYGIALEDLILVTGCDKTSAWACAAFTDQSCGLEMFFRVSQNVVGARLVWGSWVEYNADDRHSGPRRLIPPDSQTVESSNPRDEEIHSRSRLLSYTRNMEVTPRSSNQCVFLRGFRICDRWTFLLRKSRTTVMLADGTEAVPPKLPGPKAKRSLKDPGRNSGQASRSTSIGPNPPGAIDSNELDPDFQLSYDRVLTAWDHLLYYILETREEAQLAIVHDDDLCPLLQTWLEDDTKANSFELWLSEHRPKVHVSDDGDGMLRATYEHLTSERKENVDESPTTEGHATQPPLASEDPTKLEVWQRPDNRSDLDWEILGHERALELCPRTRPGHAALLYNLTKAILTRFEQSGSRADLERAVLLCEQALELRPSGHPSRAALFNNLANVISIRFERSGSLSDLDRAVLLHEQAFELYVPGNVDRLLSLNNLANAISMRFNQSGSHADLERAVLLHEQALKVWPELELGQELGLFPSEHSNRSISLHNLANAILTRFEQSGSRADLERAVLLHEQALELRPPGHPNRWVSLHNLAKTVLVRFEQFGSRADLDRAVLLREQALELCPPGHPDRSFSLHNLANAISTQFVQSGNRANIDRAVLLHEQALVLCPPGHPNRSVSLDNLANALSTRFGQSGSHADLERAVLLHEQAFMLCPPGHLNHSASLNNLANAISTRFEQSGNRADLQKVILLHWHALKLCPPGHPNRSDSLNNLANTFSMRFEQSGNRADLDKAVLLHEQALELCPPGHSARSSSLNNLADAVSKQFKLSGNSTDLDRAIELRMEALKLCPSGHPDHAALLGKLSAIVSMQPGDRASPAKTVLPHGQAPEIRTSDHYSHPALPAEAAPTHRSIRPGVTPNRRRRLVRTRVYANIQRVQERPELKDTVMS